MCKQAYIACANRSCKGWAETLALLPCENTPNCEVEGMRIPATRLSERYCRDCKGLTKRQRINANARARRQAARLAKVDNAKEKEGENHEAPFSPHAGSEEQAGPSTMIAMTGAVGGGFHHSAENSFSAPLDTKGAEEVDDRFVPLAEVNPPRPKLTGFMQHARHPSTNLFPHVTLDDQGVSPDTSTGSPTHPPFPHRSPSFWAAVKSVGTQQRIRREMCVSPEGSAFKKPRLE